jgi:hypothetical protein
MLSVLMPSKFWCATLLLCGMCQVANAGMMLDGITSNYSDYATQSQFDSSGQFTEGGSGTLIASDWVLTVGHIGNVSGFRVRGTGPTYGVSQIIRNPTFLSNGSDLNYGHDVALVKLNTSVVGIGPATLYRGNNEIGLTASFTGFGVGGVGSNGVGNLPGIHRAGTNAIDGFYDFANGTGGQVGINDAALLVDFDAPSGFGAPGEFNTLNGIGSSASPTALEYHLASGDSGGGLFIFADGQWQLAGINSGVDSQFGANGSGSTNLFGYGAISVFTRVSSYQGFIDGVTAVPEPSSVLLATVAGSLFIIRARRHRKLRESVSMQS